MTDTQDAYLAAADAYVNARAPEIGWVKPSQPVPSPTPPAPAAVATAPIVWFRFGSDAPSTAQMDTVIAKRIRGVILQSWFKDAANYLATKAKAAGYRIEIFAYKSLMDARSNAAALGADQPTFISYAEAQAGGWLTGHVMNGYEYQEVVATWDPKYQAKAVANAIAWIKDPKNAAFTGFFTDNLVSPRNDYYGTGQNESQLSAGCLAVVQQLGPQLRALGKRVMPNITDGRLNPGFFAAGSTPGDAGLEEMGFVWPNDQINTDPGPQIAEGGLPGLFYVHSNATRPQTAIYGLACAWLSGELGKNGGAYYACAKDDYNADLYWYPEYALQLGEPTTGTLSPAVSNVLSRPFTNGFAAVNTSGSAQTVTLPAGTFKDATGKQYAGRATIPGLSGLVLVKA